MTTHQDLIDTLSADVRPVSPHSAERQLGQALIVGCGITLAAVTATFGIQPDLDTMVHAAPLLVKTGYAVSLATLAGASVLTLVRPGMPAKINLRRLALPVAALALLALVQLARLPLSDWGQALLGASWSRCPLRIAILSLPVFAGLSITIRSQAPTQLRAAGATAGLVSGAVAAAAYALACPESSAAFILVWYSAGIALSTAIGALLGPKILRW